MLINNVFTNELRIYALTVEKLRSFTFASMSYNIFINIISYDFLGEINENFNKMRSRVVISTFDIVHYKDYIINFHFMLLLLKVSWSWIINEICPDYIHDSKEEIGNYNIYG